MSDDRVVRAREAEESETEASPKALDTSGRSASSGDSTVVEDSNGDKNSSGSSKEADLSSSSSSRGNKSLSPAVMMGLPKRPRQIMEDKETRSANKMPKQSSPDATPGDLQYILVPTKNP